VKILWWMIAVVALGFVLWTVSMMLGLGTSSASSSGSSSGGWTTNPQGDAEDPDTGDGGWVGAVWDAGPGYVFDMWEALTGQTSS
jgi:hypothetical protein